jgi:hypothetical protein
VTTDGERPSHRPSPQPGEPAREPAPVGWPGAPAPVARPAPQPAPGPTPTRPTAPASTPRPAVRPAAQRPVTVGAGSAARKGGRRARLTVKRIDPWSTLKFSFVYSLAGLIVLLVAVVALYGIVDAMGVLNSIRSFLHDVEGGKNSSGIAAWLSFSRVLTVAAVVGVINVILFTAFATVTAFIYNVCTDLVGGVEVTLAEKG